MDGTAASRSRLGLRMSWEKNKPLFVKLPRSGGLMQSNSPPTGTCALVDKESLRPSPLNGVTY